MRKRAKGGYSNESLVTATAEWLEQVNELRGNCHDHTHKKRGIWIWAMSLVAVGFGLLTIKEGGAILFGGEAARAAAGSYVPFVLWFNFLAGFAYVIAGIGLWMKQRWAGWLAVVIAGTMAFVFAAFSAHVYTGGAHEMRTLIAMRLRTLVWVTTAAIASRAGPTVVHDLDQCPAPESAQEFA